MRVLLGIATIAVVGLTAVVVIVANRDNRDTSAGRAALARRPAPADEGDQR